LPLPSGLGRIRWMTTLRTATRITCSLAVSVAAVATASAATQPHGEQDAQQRQLCVDRWNSTKMHWGYANTVAIVAASPCRVTLAYRPDDRLHHFACHVNRFGAYRCPSHAQGPGYDSGTWNARVRRHLLRLTQPPKVRLRFKPPAWATRYEVWNGYIIPFDRNGGRRSGLRTVAAASGSCLGPSASQPYKTGHRCFGYDNFIRDPCFSRTGRVSVGMTVLCPNEPGSTAFTRFYVKSVA
jgi:hypothetical protein